MKFRITMNDPDGPEEALDELERVACDGVEGLSPGEREFIQAQRRDRASDAIREWVECGEYVTLEFDTDAGTCRVIKLEECV
jgi:hypothetical protein